MTNAAIVGCGDVAIVHAEALAALGEELGINFVAVVDKDLSIAQDFADHVGVEAYESLPDLLAKHPVDVVHITTPHDQHIDLAIEALSQGVHVIVEKPLANELAQAQRLIDYLEAQRQSQAQVRAPKIGVCYQNRYNVSSQELRRLLDSGELGTINGAYASVVWTRTPGYYTQKPWRGQQAHSGGGLLMNQAIHTLDLLQWFLGPAESVKGTVSTDKYADVIDVEDTAHAYIGHESGVHTSFYGTLTNSRHRHVEIELDCENALVELRDGLVVNWADGRVEHFQERTQETEGRSYWGVSHELFIRDFYEKLHDEEPFWIGPEEAMSSLKIAKEIYSSSLSRK
ncbi:putative dehydrogenase [Corynebacterium suranareeae]|uniref:Putative dehydrogenase n=1 Tax=Corynebacterium suranareeae TaxID=2506452 RepID=A0A169S2R5_9CORY|nr:Gfo/Idh/MocA family oxidoreductase [Corynebacterium suranareeae]BAU96892.1 putative dehydrogenase [Corynebacterium suranareeae]